VALRPTLSDGLPLSGYKTVKFTEQHLCHGTRSFFNRKVYDFKGRVIALMVGLASKIPKFVKNLG